LRTRRASVSVVPRPLVLGPLVQPVATARRCESASPSSRPGFLVDPRSRGPRMTFLDITEILTKVRAEQVLRANLAWEQQWLDRRNLFHHPPFHDLHPALVSQELDLARVDAGVDLIRAGRLVANAKAEWHIWARSSSLAAAYARQWLPRLRGRGPPGPPQQLHELVCTRRERLIGLPSEYRQVRRQARLGHTLE
jgi:hypothetical protein